MIWKKGVIKRFGKLIQDETDSAIEEIIDGRTKHEPMITSEYLGRLKSRINSSPPISGIKFTAETFTPSGEKRTGPDFIGVLDIELDNYNIKKGFLIQAKVDDTIRKTVAVSILQGGRNPISGIFPGQNKKEFERLSNQSTSMLKVSPDSFILIYSKKGFFVLPASNIPSINNYKQCDFFVKPIKYFFQQFLLCFVGDLNLGQLTEDKMIKLIEEIQAKNLLTLYGRLAEN